MRRVPSSRALLVGVCSVALLCVVTIAYRGEGLGWGEALLTAACFIGAAVLLGHLAWRWSAARARGAWAHAGAALAYSACWTASFVLALYVLRIGSVENYLRGPAIWQAVWGFVLYAAVVASARLVRRAREQRAAAAEAELVAIRAQLSPHFLYNTLHSLTQLAREDPVATADALERFGDLMRYAVSASRRVEVALADELAFVRGYLALEHLRLGSRLTVTEHVDAEALDCAVPPLLLQPLVENAVRHGISPRARGGAVAVHARVLDEALVLEVADDGIGAPAEQLQGTTGLGLAAARRQVAAFGGAESEFALDTALGCGFRAHIRVPVRAPRPRPPR